MRRRLVFLLSCALPLAACSSPPSHREAAPPPAGQATAPPAPGTACRPQALAALTGQPATQAVIDKAMRDAGARTARVVKPGMAVTMDYREDRLTVHVDADNRIERAGCS